MSEQIGEASPDNAGGLVVRCPYCGREYCSDPSGAYGIEVPRNEYHRRRFQ